MDAGFSIRQNGSRLSRALASYRLLDSCFGMGLIVSGLIVLGLASSFSSGSLSAAEPASDSNKPAEVKPVETEVLSIQVLPTKVELKGAFDYRQLLVVGEMANGLTVDLTRVAQIQGGAGIVAANSSGQISPLADGTASITVSYGKYSKEVSVVVSDASKVSGVSFVRDVQPVLSRLGCNSGTCHGAADGKNGFKLSLRGYDALSDHQSLVDDIAARRLNRAAPDRSLMLLKPIGEVPHAGGAMLKKEDRGYKLLREWIAAGSPLDLNAPRVERIEIFPENPVLPEAGMAQQILVTAFYNDGTSRDVTGEAFVESGNIEVLSAEAGGKVNLLRRGEAPVLVRYEGRYAATTLTVMGKRAPFQWSETTTYNFIDQAVDEKLKRIQVQPSGLCSDEEFIRRLYLDLTGTVPTSQEVREFIANSAPSKVKREELIDRLVGSAPFIEHWTNKWSDLLQVNRKFLGEGGAAAFRAWIRNQVASNRPYDEFAREIILAQGSNLQQPPASYYKILREPLELMENTTHLFLAIRFNCNRCHDHPFERWTQDQYYELAAYFSQVGMKEDPRFSGQYVGGSAVMGALPLVEVIYDRDGGDIKNERTGKTAEPKFPYPIPSQANVTTPASQTRREQLSQWLTSRDNPFFAKSYVNRVWGYLTGVGIIEPIDDIRAGNPPTNPLLLDALTKHFVDHSFDTQDLIRTICKSRTYQLSIDTNESNEEDTLNYSHAVARRLPAEVLYDAIYRASGSTTKIANLPPGIRAAELPDAGVSLPFLDDFGRPVRESACECERSSGVVLGPIIKLVNGDTVAAAITDPNGELNKIVAQQPDDQLLIEEVFYRFLGRKPTDRERELAMETLAAPGMQLEEVEKQLAEYVNGTQRENVQRWADKLIVNPQWEPLTWTDAESTVGAMIQPQSDGSFLATGNLKMDKYILRAKVKGLSALRLETMTDPSLPNQGPGRSASGNFVLSELIVKAAPADAPMQLQAIPLASPQADFAQQGFPVANAIDGNVGTGWAVHPDTGKPHEAIFRLSQPLSQDKEWIVVIELDQQYTDGQHNLGRFRFTGLARDGELVRDIAAPLMAALAVPANDRSPQDWELLTAEFRKGDSAWMRLNQAVDQARTEKNNRRQIGIQDLAWALINSPAFLFNR